MTEAEDYDIAMSIADAIRRRSFMRWFTDIGILLLSVGLWGGWLIVETLLHHWSIKTGDTEPWQSGDEKEFWIVF
jgi:hypothetical protein